MNWHPCIPAIMKRYADLDSQVRSGRLSLNDAVAQYAWVMKDRNGNDALGLSQLASAIPTEANDDELSLPFVITTFTEDRDGDVVRPQGIQLHNFAHNPVCSFGHFQNPNYPLPIAKCKSPDGRLTVYPEENRATCVMYFDKEDEFAVKVYKKYKGGYLNATSIAFVPISATRRDREAEKGMYENRAHTHTSPMSPPGWMFDVVDLTEIAAVPVPANAGAIRDWVDTDKELTTAQRKALLPYAAKALGRSFSGWCPPGTVMCPDGTCKKSAGGVSQDSAPSGAPPTDEPDDEPPTWDAVVDGKAWGTVQAPDEETAKELVKRKLENVRIKQMDDDYGRDWTWCDFKAKFPEPKVAVKGPYGKVPKAVKKMHEPLDGHEYVGPIEQTPPRERWNKQLSSAFDAMPELLMSEPEKVGAATTHRVAAKYLGCQIKDLPTTVTKGHTCKCAGKAACACGTTTKATGNPEGRDAKIAHLKRRIQLLSSPTLDQRPADKAKVDEYKRQLAELQGGKSAKAADPILPRRSRGGEPRLAPRDPNKIYAWALENVFGGDHRVTELPEWDRWSRDVARHYVMLRTIPERQAHRQALESAYNDLRAAARRAGVPVRNFSAEQAMPTDKSVHRYTLKGRVVQKYITHSGDKWIVHAESGKVLGTHDSKESAEAQLRAVEANKHKAIGPLTEDQRCMFGAACGKKGIGAVGKAGVSVRGGQILVHGIPVRGRPPFKVVQVKDRENYTVGYNIVGADGAKTDFFDHENDAKSRADELNRAAAQIKSISKAGAVPDPVRRLPTQQEAQRIAAEQAPWWPAFKPYVGRDADGWFVKWQTKSMTKGWTVHAEDVQPGQEVIVGQGDAKIREVVSNTRDASGRCRITFADGTAAVRDADYPIKVKQLVESSGTAGGYTVAVDDVLDDPTIADREAVCAECGGSGQCTACDGSGVVAGKPCDLCGGSGECVGCAGAGMVAKAVKSPNYPTRMRSIRVYRTDKSIKQQPHNRIKDHMTQARTKAVKRRDVDEAAKKYQQALSQYGENNMVTQRAEIAYHDLKSKWEQENGKKYGAMR